MVTKIVVPAGHKDCVPGREPLDPEAGQFGAAAPDGAWLERYLRQK